MYSVRQAQIEETHLFVIYNRAYDGSFACNDNAARRRKIDIRHLFDLLVYKVLDLYGKLLLIAIVAAGTLALVVTQIKYFIVSQIIYSLRTEFGRAQQRNAQGK